ncbi:hypothetical protein [Tuberibacillus sp. Marseille-P3662]|uniref:hypothetical protein n=1 Tax=Tuberibacillus sp. Marseille-P3662 TaxID=1965358 RepID=UPI000A1C91E8|nr:hypothetical protein [Tuberibacillus sp. Marseille-P3662]
MSEEIFNEISDMLKRDTMSKFGRKSREAYKYFLCGLLCDIFNHGIFIYNHPHPHWYSEIKFLINRFDDDNLEEINFEPKINDVKVILDSNNFKWKSNVNEIISFFRSYINDYLNKGKTLYLVPEFKPIMYIDSYMAQAKGIALKEHIWIDINPKDGLTPTYPEFINYSDLINLWNDLIHKKNNFHRLIDDKSDDKKAIRELELSISSSARWLIISGVTFVESYLYYVFYNARKTDSYGNSQKLKKIMKRNPQKINDKEILKGLINKVCENITGDERYNELYEKYIKIVDVRDRFIHTSAFINPTNQISNLQPFMNVDMDFLTDSLQGCIDFVKKIEEELPKDLKLLFWWSIFYEPDFTKEEKISILNRYIWG